MRFKGFTEPWSHVRLSDFAERVVRKNKNNETELPLTISSKDGLVDQITFFNKTVASKDMSGYYLLKNGEYAYNKSYSAGYDFGSIKRLERYPIGALSTLYICFSLKKYNSDYIKTYFDSLKWYKEIYMISAEGARNHGLLNVPTDEFFETHHYITENICEQEKIALLMSLIEQRIQKQQALVDNLKKYKRGVLRKVFDKINYSCNKRALGDICISISSGKTTSIKELGKYPLIGSTGPIGYTDIEEFNEELILIARVGANAGTVNYFNGSCGVTDNTLVVRVDNTHYNPKYILNFLEYYDPHRLIFGSGQPLVTGGQLKKIEVPVVGMEQQEKIVELFMLLNKHWINAQHQLDLLIDEKKALLQQLFI